MALVRQGRVGRGFASGTLPDKQHQFARRGQAPVRARMDSCPFALDPTVQAQPVLPGARHTKARSRHQRESRLEFQALYAGSHLCWDGAGWIWSRTTSSMACRVRRQKSVSVEAKEPFSESLLTGAPPPQKRK